MEEFRFGIYFKLYSLIGWKFDNVGVIFYMRFIKILLNCGSLVKFFCFSFFFLKFICGLKFCKKLIVFVIIILIIIILMLFGDDCYSSEL